jgi:hypothetical protein
MIKKILDIITMIYPPKESGKVDKFSFRNYGGTLVYDFLCVKL